MILLTVKPHLTKVGLKTFKLYLYRERSGLLQIIREDIAHYFYLFPQYLPMCYSEKEDSEKLWRKILE